MLRIEELNCKFKKQSSNSDRLTSFDLKTKVIAIEINEFIIANLNLIREAIAQSVEHEYRIQDLYEKLNVFVIKRVPINIMESIQMMKTKCGIPSSEE